MNMDSVNTRTDALMRLAAGMRADVERVAAFGAHLRALTEPLQLPPDVEAAVRDVAEAILPGVSELPAEVLARVKLGVVALLRQAADLIERPDREPGWLTDDPVVVQAQGRASIAVGAILDQAASELDDLTDRLAAGGAFCDVGTGAGWLAIGAARQWPAARVVGLDVAASVLELAAQNVDAAGLSHRITLVCRDVCDLEDGGFDLIWMPGPFLGRALVPKALDAAYRSLNPGGWVAFGTYADTADAVATKLSTLWILRCGGYPWTAHEIGECMRAGGYERVAEVDRQWNAPIQLVVGRKAG